MNMRWILIAFLSTAWVGQVDALAQTSSLGAKKRQADAQNPPRPEPREATRPKVNPVYEQHSWVSIRPKPPRTFKVNDLITVIVRQRSKYEADAELETKKEWDIKSELDAFIKGTAGGIGSAAFRRGKPNINYKFSNELKGEGDASREDKLTTRLTVKIIDIKPNGLLVLEGRGSLEFDDESSEITLIGTCRKEDVTADNTILSTQIADLKIKVDNDGALRASSSRGWILKLLDWLKPL